LKRVSYSLPKLSMIKIIDSPLTKHKPFLHLFCSKQPNTNQYVLYKFVINAENVYKSGVDRTSSSFNFV
jgi:hypothetical protein